MAGSRGHWTDENKKGNMQKGSAIGIFMPGIDWMRPERINEYNIPGRASGGGWQNAVRNIGCIGSGYGDNRR